MGPGNIPLNPQIAVSWSDSIFAVETQARSSYRSSTPLVTVGLRTDRRGSFASNLFGSGTLLRKRRAKGLPESQPGTLDSRPWSAPTPPNFSSSRRFHFTLAILSPHHAALQTTSVGEQRLQKFPLREGHEPSRSANGPKQTQPLQPPTVGRWPQRAIADRDSWIEAGWPSRSVHIPAGPRPKRSIHEDSPLGRRHRASSLQTSLERASLIRFRSRRFALSSSPP